ncbi:ABC transporter substrate-binding protein [Pseudogemmobacter humi]|uniref:NMT1/THI5 like protein n=1 Tax=Pseudogemmobacter humi TaxID=2483812 RepID=A0A3P5XP24_9RHOB|nr:ABC transporter substrate-binding protein [Pseudogemmobacter humi]VDC30507.1 NMT1/THI5 like protein [Pseudogemmobacter humi]
MTAFKGITAALLGLLTVTAGPLSAQELKEVRINQAFQSLLYLPLYVAQERGYFEENGVKVSISTAGGGAQAWAAVIGGSADFSIQDPVFVAKTREMGGDGVAVAGVQNAPTVFIIGKDATSLQDNLAHMSGKRVIVGPQPDTTWAFMSVLAQQNGVEDLKMVNVSIGNEIPAITTGQADYALAVDPQVTQGILEHGLTSVYSYSANADWYPYAFSSLTTTQAYIDGNPEAALGIVTAFEQASRHIYADFDDAVEVAKIYFPNLPEEVVRQAVQREIDARGYPENVLISEEAWANSMNVSVFAGTLQGYPTEATSYETNVNTDLATRAKEAVDARQ